MDFYAEFFYGLFGFLIGLICGWAIMLIVLKAAADAGKIKFKNDDGTWMGKD
jgi:ABC-type antimicrobial peptide transport system permease subunit